MMVALIVACVALALSLALTALRIRDWHRWRVHEARIRELRGAPASVARYSQHALLKR
jgi:hypothetical protein